jgi:hypothetical protein
VGFVVDKVALGQTFSEYFGFPCQSLFHQLIHATPRSVVTAFKNGTFSRLSIPPWHHANVNTAGCCVPKRTLKKIVLKIINCGFDFS